MGYGDMSISAFSRQSLLSVKALRLYDEMGLLSPARVDPDTRYRYYHASQLGTARMISLLRKLDVPLADIARIVELSPEDASRLLSEWWHGEELRREKRRDLLRYIQGSVLGDIGDPSNLDVQVRLVPETTWLYLSGHVHGDRLPEFIGRSNALLQERARVYGGAIGYGAVVFHGVVDMDSDGPADVCWQIPPGSQPHDGDQIRTESVHTQAFTVLRKREMEFPQILQVYRDLRRWIEANGHTISGPPRELYLGDFVAAEPNDPICEIAFPIQPNQGEPQ